MTPLHLHALTCTCTFDEPESRDLDCGPDVPVTLPSMTWDHRVVEEDGILYIAEVTYENDKPRYWCKASVMVNAEDGETINDLRDELRLMVEAAQRPILNAATDFVGKE